MAQLADLLAPHLTVFHYDRRRRVDSGDTPPYAVEREIEDIQALINAAGGSAFLFGISSGAALVNGDASERQSMRITAMAAAKAMPHAQHRTLEGQTHEVTPEALAPVLVEFFK